jgi:hypothetical protein
MSAVDQDGRPTRRELISDGIATAAAASVLTATLERAAVASTEPDAPVLSATLAVEQLVLFAYHHVLASGALEPRPERIVRHLRHQELQHISALGRELIGLGGRPPPVPTDPASVERALAAHHIPASLTNLRSQHDCLRLLVDVETIVERAYYAAISKLRDPRLLGTSAAIMACEAQHWTLLSSIQHRGDVSISVPYAFVQGAVI